QSLVALHRDRKVALVLERQPGAAVRQHVGLRSRGGVERRAHALADRLVPGALVVLDVDAGRLPQLELGDVRARAVATRDEGLRFGLDGAQRLDDVRRPADAGRIAARAD